MPSHAVNAFSSVGSNDEEQPLVADQAPKICVVSVDVGTASLVTPSKVPSDVKSVRDMRFEVFTNQPSAVAKFNRTAEPKSPTKRGSGSAKRSGSCKKRVVKRGSKAIEKPEKSGSLSKVGPSLVKIKMRNLVPSVEVWTVFASIGDASTHEIPDVEVHDDGALMLSARSSSGKDGTYIP